MKKIIRSCIAIIIVCMIAMQLVSCKTNDGNDNKAEIVQANVIKIEKYGHAVLDITTADFIAAGYALGDIVCVSFGTYEYTMPFYDGYYSNPKSLMLRGSTLEDYIAVCINYGDFSSEKNINIGDTARITMSEKAGMRDIQELYALQYSNDLNDYPNTATFTNFRAVTAGRIKEGKLYRTASPINNENGRANFANNFIESVGVATVLNLSDSYQDVEKYLANTNCNSEYYRNLYANGKVIAVDLTGNFYSDEFAYSVVEGLNFLAKNEPPYCIHCTEGKDRTGFTAMILEALLGATLDEIIDDYMLSFYNYYGINKDKEPKRYQAVLNVNLMEMLSHVTGESVERLYDINLETSITSYLIGVGMAQNDILTLKEKLS